MLAGIRSSFSSSSSHVSVWMLKSIVREALVTSVMCVASLGELPDQPAVDGAERQLAGLGARRARRGRCRESSDLAAGEVGVDDEAGAFADELFVAVALQPVAEVGRAAVLPDDRVVDRLAGLAIPDDGRLALVGDADGGDVARPEVRAPERLGRDRDLRRPDLAGVVLDPAGLREDLLKLALADGDDGRVVIEDDRARAGGALVEGEDVRHGSDSGSDSRRAGTQRLGILHSAVLPSEGARGAG